MIIPKLRSTRCWKERACAFVRLSSREAKEQWAAGVVKVVAEGEDVAVAERELPRVEELLQRCRDGSDNDP